MSFTERYASLNGGGAFDGTSEADAWTFSQAVALAVTGALITGGTRINVKSGGTLTAGAVTLTGSNGGRPIIFRGYEAITGDLDSYRRTNNGPLNTVGMPFLNITGGPLVLGSSNIFQNFNMSGALASTLVGGSVSDNWTLWSCKVINTQNNAAARALQGDNECRLITCDIECNGAAHSAITDFDATPLIFDTRFKGADTDAMVSTEGGTFINCVFEGNGNNAGIQTVSSTSPLYCLNNTFYNLKFPTMMDNATQSMAHVFVNNIVTDCQHWISGAFVTNTILEIATRIRDVGIPFTNFDSVGYGNITTDTGGASTDFVDAPNGDFRLVTNAPGRAVGVPPYMDIGAAQALSASGSSSEYSFTYIH